MDKIIAIEFKTQGKRYLSIDSIPEAVAIHAHESLELFNKELEDFKNDYLANTRAIAGKNSLRMDVIKLDREKFHKFISVYSRYLLEDMKENPKNYWGDFKTTINNMAWAILKGTFHKESENFKKTCKELKIKHTYKAIDEFLNRLIKE